MVLSPKASLEGYLVILGRPWLATTNACIGCRSGDMTISDGYSIKKLTLYSLALPQLEFGDVVWPDLGEEEEVNCVANLMMITREPFIAPQKREDILSNILLNNYITEYFHCEKNPCSLQTIPLLSTSAHYPPTTNCLHTLLPHEVDMPFLFEVSMIDLTSQVEVAIGKP